jgi:tRNA (guanine-N7-)-methyltransferase
MVRNKLDKFKENDNWTTIVQPGKPIFENIKGNWNSRQFKNKNPIVLELACGRGEYSIGLAKIFPDKNFIGVDIKGPRIWRGGKLVEEENLNNVAFLRAIIQNIENFFENDEIDEIWITFPDPRPKGRDERRRLTHPRFLNIYNRIMKRGGWVHLKTDNLPLFEYSLEMVSNHGNSQDLVYTNNLYDSKMVDEHYNIKTTYEGRYLDDGIPIHYLKFRLM